MVLSQFLSWFSFYLSLHSDESLWFSVLPVLLVWCIALWDCVGDVKTYMRVCTHTGEMKAFISKSHSCALLNKHCWKHKCFSNAYEWGNDVFISSVHVWGSSVLLMCTAPHTDMHVSVTSFPVKFRRLLCAWGHTEDSWVVSSDFITVKIYPKNKSHWEPIIRKYRPILLDFAYSKYRTCRLYYDKH